MKPPLFGGPRLAMRTPHGNCAVVLQAGEACQKDIMYITNQIEFKATASALRRELKKAYPEAPSHAAVLELLAKALGASSFAELNASLPRKARALPEAPDKASEPETPRYPLRNLDGRYDLVDQGEEGVPLRGWGFDTLKGTSEKVHCTADVASATRNGKGNLDLEFGGGGTEVDWDSSVTDKDASGQAIWVCESDDRVTSPFLVLVPHEACLELAAARELDGLPLRENLIQEYVLLARELGKVGLMRDELEAGKKTCLEEIETTLRFSLHALEEKRLIEALKA
jgi:hypothetical protein